MEKTLQCECGFLARADDEAGLVDEVQRHARDVHGMTLSHDDALLLTFRAELGTQAPLPSPPDPRRQRKEQS